MGFTTCVNDGYDCVELQHSLDHTEKNIWLVDDPKHAEWVRLNSTPHYNADYDTPTNTYEPEDLEVVTIRQTISARKTKVSIPTPREFHKKAFDIQHWIYIKNLFDKGEVISYTWSQLKYYLQHGKLI